MSDDSGSSADLCALYKSILDSLPDMVFVKNQAGTLIYTNHAVRSEIGSDFVGKNVFDYMEDDERDTVQRMDETVLRDGRPVEYDLSLRLPGTMTRRIFRFKKSRFRDPESGAFYLTIYVRDVTELRRHEQERQREKTMATVSSMAGGLARDLNNMLVGIIGNAQLAQMRLESGQEIVRSLESIIWSGEQAAELARQFLLLSKAGPVRPSPTRLNEILPQAVAFALQDSDTRHTLSIPEDLKPVFADRTQLSQAIVNLVRFRDGAMGGNGRLTVMVSEMCMEANAEVPLPAGRYARIVILDKGRRIPAESLSHIFDPYFSFQDHAGGVDLAVSEAIVRGHGGLIAVESTDAHGTVITVYLPAMNDLRDDK